MLFFVSIGIIAEHDILKGWYLDLGFIGGDKKLTICRLTLNTCAMNYKKNTVNTWILFLVSVLVLLLPVKVPAKNRPFYFVQITDTHLGILENRNRTRKVVAAINDLPMKIVFVVHTGDIYDRTSRKDEKAIARAAEVFRDLKPPLYFLPGNNEINLTRDTRESRKRYTQHFGPLVSGAEHNGVYFLFAYTDPLRESLSMAGFDPVLEIKKGLKKANGKPVILFHHGPSVRDFYNNQYHDGWEKKVQDQWQGLVNQDNIKAVIAGHFHRDEFHWLGDVPLYIAGPVAEKYGRQACFRIYEYQDGRVGYTTQYLE